MRSSDFEIRSRRGNEADGFTFSGNSACQRTELKRQRTAALQDLAEEEACNSSRQRLGVRLSSAALTIAVCSTTLLRSSAGIASSLVLTLGLCLTLGSVAAQDTNQSVFVQESLRVKESIRSMDSLDSKQKLGPGDKITYRVIEDQDEPKSLLITDSGDLEVPYLGLVHAAGKTCAGLANEVKGLLEKNLYFRATVMISAEVINKTRATGKVYVTGFVRNPGGFDLPAGQVITVSRAILMAGGFTDFSDKRNVRLIRKKGAESESRPVNVQEVLEKGKLDADLVVEPEDMIVVKDRLVKW